MKTFGAIYIGSYVISLKVYEITPKKGPKVLDGVEYRNEIEKDVLNYGHITNDTIASVCDSLLSFKKVMQTYDVKDYSVYLTPSFNRATNRHFAVSMIKTQTGMDVVHLSNSEQKLVYFKALMENPGFEAISRESILIVSVGGNSIQASLMENGDVITTQLVPLSIVRMREQLSTLDLPVSKRSKHISDLINKELHAFREMFSQNINPKYLIVIGDYVNDILRSTDRKVEGQILDKDSFVAAMEEMTEVNNTKIGGISKIQISDSLVEPFIMMYQCLAESSTAQYVWIPGISIHDGIFLDYAFNNKWLTPTHDFEKDIIEASRQIAKRYRNDERHDNAIKSAAVAIFDGFRKYHGLRKRYRFLLETAIILHDCGRYVSLARRAQCAHDIIIASEIIGLSHRERKIVANVVLYNREEFPLYEDFEDNITQEDYVIVAKLAAILRLADALDSSNTQKVETVNCSVKDDMLVVSVETNDDIFFERLEFDNKSKLFETVYNLKPVLKEHRIL